MCILVCEFHILKVCAISKLYLCRYVDVILQLIDKAGDFVSDDIWYRVVQFVTNNEDLQVGLYIELHEIFSFLFGKFMI
jgi:hypothetical protein